MVNANALCVELRLTRVSIACGRTYHGIQMENASFWKAWTVWYIHSHQQWSLSSSCWSGHGWSKSFNTLSHLFLQIDSCAVVVYRHGLMRHLLLHFLALWSSCDETDISRNLTASRPWFLLAPENCGLHYYLLLETYLQITNEIVCLSRKSQASSDEPLEFGSWFNPDFSISNPIKGIGMKSVNDSSFWTLRYPMPSQNRDESSWLGFDLEFFKSNPAEKLGRIHIAEPL